MTNNDKNRKQTKQEFGFQSDLMMDSMLAKWYQSEQDAEQFWNGVSDRIEGRTESTLTTLLDSADMETSSSRRSLNLERFQVGLLAASLLVGGFTYLLIHRLDPPVPDVAQVNVSNSADEVSAELLMELDSSVASSSISELQADSECDLLIAEPVELFELTESEVNDRLLIAGNIDIPSSEVSADVESAEPVKQPKPKLERKPKSKFLATVLANENKTIRTPKRDVEEIDQSKAFDDALFPVPKYLSLAIERNRSGYVRISINERVTVKKLLPKEAARILEQAGPAFFERMKVLGPRIGPIVGNIFLGESDDGERLEFESLPEFRDVLATAVDEVSKFTTKYRRRRGIQESSILKSVTLRTNDVFQEWAKEAIEFNTPVMRSGDPSEKFVRYIDIEEFRRYARNGKFSVPGLGKQYLTSTKIQDLNATKLRRRLVGQALQVNLFRSSEELKEFETSIRAEQKRNNQQSVEPIKALVADRPDLAGLPLVMEDDCRMSGPRSISMDHVSRRIGPVLSRFDAFSTRSRNFDPNLASKRRELLSQNISAIKSVVPSNKKKNQQELLTVDQMLQIEEPELRLELVGMLGKSRSKVSANLLACYVKFDLDETVRMSATKALSNFPLDWVRPKLLEGLRYPWPDAAKHAAEGLVRLNDTKAIPKLVEYLQSPDPTTPQVSKEGHYVKRELVAINHLKNCMLCHADSAAESDKGRAPVPSWERPLPQLYYNARPSGLVARADVTYLRQDFSVVQKVDNPGRWPADQRFDYVVRKTKLTDDEAKALQKKAGDNSFDEYREAIVFALQMLTDQTPSNNSYANWKKIATDLGYGG